MKIGDNVKLVQLPPDLPEGDKQLPTRATFEKCLGHSFEICSFNEIGWAELDIKSVTGSVGESIWVDVGCLEPA